MREATYDAYPATKKPLGTRLFIQKCPAGAGH